MRMLSLLFVVVMQFSTNAWSQKAGDEPGWSIMIISVASACGTDRAKVDLATTYVAQWATRHLSDSSQLTHEKVLKIVDENQDIKDVVKKKGAFIHPCDRWQQMLDVFLQSKGSVMESQSK